ncbi:response regulator [Sphingosinicella sp. CPCC 101087]|uniref:response regulator n=1 Tax=Sphingosinicella sp. CPCC 101087 TaxID=2497754 RepID=UPI00101C6291|nr:response regulator [Sphingosinicella sp. CPCC 101087]
MTEETFIAVVEDDAEIGTLMTRLLKREGFAAECVGSGSELDRLRARRRIDLVVLDLMLPGEDGLSICRRLRSEGDVPVLMVTARSDDVDRIVGLEIGADDYLGKPFNPRELVARARAILRRTRPAHRVGRAPPDERWRFSGFLIDVGARALLAPGGSEVELTGGEFDLLLALARHPQRVLGRDQLLDWTRGRSSTPYDRSIDVLIGRLRRKLSSHADGSKIIKTVRGGGYVLAMPVERA